jgi:LCP family protein required for cell wall assembly
MKKRPQKPLPKAAHRFDVGKTLPPHPVSLNPHRPHVPEADEPSVQASRGGAKRIILRLLLSVVIALVAFIVIIGVWDARNINQASQKMFGSSLLGLLSQSGLKTDASGRVNVLVVGYSADDPGHPAAKLTDSIMLLSMNPNSKNGYMLSIPRDLYVKIPGFGYGKINEAYQDGGMDLLARIVSDNFGVTVPYYSLVNYSSVKGSVDALGGINVCIDSSDPRGLYDPNISSADGGPLKLANGCQNIDGQTALNLTRARGDPAPDGRIAYGFARSDFDRTLHQRQVFTAIKQKIGWKVILDPSKNSQLFNAVGDNVKTNIEGGEALPIFKLFRQIPQNQLRSVSLADVDGRNYLRGYTTPYGQSALIPAAGLGDYSDIQQVVSQL